MRGFEAHCERRKSLICTRFIMRIEEIFRRFGVQIGGSCPVDRFLLMLDIKKFIILLFSPSPNYCFRYISNKL